MIDKEGYRPNVGIIITNQKGKLFWARRIKQRAWQFPQGGVNDGEAPLVTLYRELYEEVGLRPEDVEILGATQGWLKYQLPEYMQRRDYRGESLVAGQPVCIGQKQKWFLLRLMGSETHINFGVTEHPEFDQWRWVDYWHPLTQVIPFKRHVYRNALERFFPMVQSLKNKG